MLRACGAVLMASTGPAVIGGARALATSGGAAAATKVGLVGLGRVGSRFLNRLLDAGHEVVLHDSNKLAVDRALAAGKAHPAGIVSARDSPAEIAAEEGTNIVLTVLPDNSSLEEVFHGRRGLLRAPGGLRTSLFVNISTVEPRTVQRLAAAVRAARVAPGATPLTASGVPELLDAPATGGVVGADSGTMCFCVGAGSVADVEAARPVLDVLGNHITHTGPVGSGSVAKLCNALVMSASMTAVAEALALGRRMGVDPAVLSDVLNSGSGRTWAGEVYSPAPGVCPGAPASQGYRAGQEVDQVRAQLRMLIRAGEAAHSPVPCARFTEQIYSTMHDEGLGDMDFSSVYRFAYGSGCDNPAWQEGQQLHSAAAP